jgi:carbon storage regulator
MLVLARRKDQSIMIGDNIEVVVVDISSDQVKLGIMAPRNVSVHRREVYEAIKSENIAARSRKAADLDSLAKFFKRREDDDS